MKKLLILQLSLLNIICHAAQPSPVVLARKAQAAAQALTAQYQLQAARRIQMLCNHLMPPAPKVVSTEKQHPKQPFGKHCVLSAVPNFKQFCCLPLTDVVLINGDEVSAEHLL